MRFHTFKSAAELTHKFISEEKETCFPSLLNFLDKKNFEVSRYKTTFQRNRGPLSCLTGKMKLDGCNR